MTDQGATRKIEEMLAECDPLIRKRIRNRLGVTLDQEDGRKRNQDVLLTVYDATTLKLIEELTSVRDGLARPVSNVRGYALTITDHYIAAYLNDINPLRRELKDKLRYCLETRQGYALWKSEGPKFLCGLARWQFQEQVKGRTGDLLALRDNPQLLTPTAVLHKHIDRMKPDDWLQFLDGVFAWAGAPVWFDDLVNLAAQRLGIRDEFRQTTQQEDGGADELERLEPPDRRSPNPFDELVIKEYLRHLWAAICQLKPLVRAAYLLSLGAVGKKATQQALTDIQLFPAYEVATMNEIGRLLDISEAQFTKLWEELLDLNETERLEARMLETYEEKFAFLWKHLPLQDDQAIGALLGVKPESLRVARHRAINDYLQPQLQAFGYRL